RGLAFSSARRPPECPAWEIRAIRSGSGRPALPLLPYPPRPFPFAVRPQVPGPSTSPSLQVYKDVDAWDKPGFFAHDLIRKPVPTFRDHALRRIANARVHKDKRRK